MQRSSLENNLKPMHNLIIAIWFLNMNTGSIQHTETDFLSASSAQKMNISGLMRNYITFFSTRFTN